jgi:phospholipid/cholesterol/gamma-HCH transport system substrate-binding protein
MKRDIILNRVKLGMFVFASLALITALIFYIGSNQHKFGNKKIIYSYFGDVSGLAEGNPVRFQGVTIGVVESVEIASDSMVKVTLAVDAKKGKFIRKDSRASILSEGVIGAKFISISSGSSRSGEVEDEGTIPSSDPLSIEDVMASLTETSISAKNVVMNLESITNKINKGEGIVGALISDNQLRTRVDNMLYSFEEAGKRTEILTGKLSLFADSLGIAGGNAIHASENAAEASENILEFTKQLNNPHGPLQKLIGDTVLANKMDKTISNANQMVKDIGQTSCRIRNHWFMRMFAKGGKEE